MNEGFKPFVLGYSNLEQIHLEFYRKQCLSSCQATIFGAPPHRNGSCAYNSPLDSFQDKVDDSPPLAKRRISLL